MAFKSYSMRRDILVKDILFTMLSHESVIKDILARENKDFINQTLIDVSVDLADRLWGNTQVNRKAEETDKSDDVSLQLSPIVLDGELGDL